jgi:acyl carrier protein
VVMEIEKDPGIVIPDEIAESFHSIRDVIEYLRRRQDE